MGPLLNYLSPVRKRLGRILPYWSLAILKSLWAEYSFRQFKPRIVRHRYGKYDFQLQLVDFDGECWLDKDDDGAAFAEIALLKKHKLVAGAKVFNAGANQCLQAMMMGREVEPGGLIYAVEPNSHNTQAGRRNCELNGIHNVRVIEAAVSSTPGKLWFNSAMNGQVAVSRHEAGAHLVDVVTIDGLTAKFGRPDVLYIDVEGFECEVLEGAKSTMASHAPDCFIEVHLQMGLERYGGSLERVLSFFPSSRYLLFYSNGSDGVFRQVEPNVALPEKRFYLVALSLVNNRSLDGVNGQE